MTTLHAVPDALRISPDELSIGAAALMELACDPNDGDKLAAAADQIIPLTAHLRDAAGLGTDDSDWLSLAHAVGVVRERTH
ncbi:hypothetical protein RVR_P224 (plasmid) [Actinacidiphila reveromycinica]|uniref:Uncharacterized protein n=1 Tax=Actinacidiphila reveromycinica TaxID=659352 RepID=A0A7R6QF31_9ACTN|nr:hypothetical protein [Streptomyces sp. SN-593]BBG20767.1 hypothetical protein RVR_P224 [Streptomyces sp. SN-593]